LICYIALWIAELLGFARLFLPNYANWTISNLMTPAWQRGMVPWLLVKPTLPLLNFASKTNTDLRKGTMPLSFQKTQPRSGTLLRPAFAVQFPQ